MDAVRHWFHANLDVVYFFYGLAFFTHGHSFTFAAKKGKRIKIAMFFGSWLHSALRMDSMNGLKCGDYQEDKP